VLEYFQINEDNTIIDKRDGKIYGGLTEALMVAEFGFCDCGAPEKVLQYIKTMLLTYVTQCQETPTDSRNNAEVSFFLYWADTHGYTEHGGSVNASWMSGEGFDLLDTIDQALLKKDNREADGITALSSPLGISRS